MNTFEKQVESFTTGFVNGITALSPMVLILIILGIAASGAYVEYLFQQSIFAGLAAVPAILVGGIRFSSGMGGISLIKQERYLPGIFFIAVSLLLTSYSYWHIETISEQIAPLKPEQAALTIGVILWSGFIGELMICAYMFGKREVNQKEITLPTLPEEVKEDKDTLEDLIKFKKDIEKKEEKPPLELNLNGNGETV